MKPIIIIQARLNSKRLPQKVLKPILGYPLLYYTITRLSYLKLPFKAVVATTSHVRDQAIVDFCDSLGIDTFRGSEENVLERFYQTSLLFPSKVYVRVTGDCPLIDPHLLEEMLTFFISNIPKYDYLSNTLSRSYPKGLDIEIFTHEALKKAYYNAKEPYEQEHVTPYIYQNKSLFSLHNFKDKEDFSKVNISVDTLQDFYLVKELIEKYYPKNPSFGLNEIKEHLSLKEIAHV